MYFEFLNICLNLKTIEWDIPNPDRLINLEINNSRRKALFNLEIKKKSGSTNLPDIRHSKVSSSGKTLSKTIAKM